MQQSSFYGGYIFLLYKSSLDFAESTEQQGGINI